MLLPASILDLGGWMEAFILVFLRISALFLAAPFFGANSINVRIRILLAGLTTILILPSIPALGEFKIMSGVGLLAIVQQLFLGLAMGFIIQLVFTGLIVGGQVMAMTMGLGFATTFDPQNGVSVPVISQFYTIFGTLIFLALDLHLHLLSYMAGSFELLPITGANMNADGFMVVVGWASHMFSGAVLLALPTLAAILLVNVAFGVMTRAAPQLNIFAVGFPVTIAVGFLFIMLTVDSLLPIVSRYFEHAFEAMNHLLP